MTRDEKLAIQTLVLNELARHQDDHPTMLIDALLADQAHGFLLHLLSQVAGNATQLAQTTAHLLRAVQQATESPRVPPSEEVA
jgi:hypothetical protein